VISAVQVQNNWRESLYSHIISELFIILIVFSIQTGPKAHSASWIIGNGCLSGVMRLERDVDYPPASSTEIGYAYQYQHTVPAWHATFFHFYDCVFGFKVRMRHIGILQA
jgi:hypothetical protein